MMLSVQPLSLVAARKMLEDIFGVTELHADTMIEHAVAHGALRLTATSLAEHGAMMRPFEADVVPASIIRDAELDIETNTLHVAHGTLYGIATTFADFDRIWPMPRKRDRSGVGGRSYVADWPAYERLLNEEIAIVGMPDRNGVPGWRTQTDVCRWIAERMADDENPSPTTIKENVRAMLARIKKDGN